MTLSLLSPAWLSALGLAAPLIALYILRARRERRTVAWAALWRAASRDPVASTPWKRLVRERALLLQLLALVAGAVALSRPTLSLRSDEPRLAIVVDTSASMGARDAEGTRMARAIVEARALAEGARHARPILYEAGADVALRAGPEASRADVLAAISRLESHEIAGTLPRAVAAAAEDIARSPGGGEIVVITDGGERIARPDGVALRVVDVSRPADNVGITRLEVKRLLSEGTGPDTVSVEVVVESRAASPREVGCVAHLGDASGPVVARASHTIAAGGGHVFALRFPASPAAAGQPLVVSLDHGGARDALSADDAAYARVPPSARLPVKLVGTASPWLERVLEADRSLDVARITAEGAARGEGAGALVVQEGQCADPKEAGGVLVFGPPPSSSCLGVTVGARLEIATLTSWETTHPLFRFLTFDGVHVREGSPLSGAPSLLRAGNTTLIADVSRAGRPGAVISFPTSETDWPLRASFVLFVHNVVDAMRTEDAAEIGAARTGVPLRVRVPSGSGEVTLSGPRGLSLRAAPRDGIATFAAVDRTGTYRASFGGGALSFGVNLASANETDLSSREAIAAAPAAGASPVARAPEPRELWPLLALLALLALAADALLLTQTRTARPLGGSS